MKRKYGFTLVELLIVLAVIAALIATITPLALNAIRRARALQVAQNLRTLASGIENAALVNGIFTVGSGDAAVKYILGPRGIADAENPAVTDSIRFADIGRDIDTARYGVSYEVDFDGDAGTIQVWVYTTVEANVAEVMAIIKNVKDATEDPITYEGFSGTSASW